MEQEKNDYIQVKYSWKEAEYNYNCRWHTKTPNAPSYQGASWVIERKKSGIQIQRPSLARIQSGRHRPADCLQAKCKKSKI